jgi:hypothetical protein
VIGPDGAPLTDLHGVPLRDGWPVRHADAPDLRGRILRQATPTKVTVWWRRSATHPVDETTPVPADKLICEDHLGDDHA